MEKEYLTAEEARKIADDNAYDLKSALKDIKHCSLRGETKLTISYVDGLQEVLTELGYNVKRIHYSSILIENGLLEIKW